MEKARVFREETVSPRVHDELKSSAVLVLVTCGSSLLVIAVALTTLAVIRRRSSPYPSPSIGDDFNTTDETDTPSPIGDHIDPYSRSDVTPYACDYYPMESSPETTPTSLYSGLSSRVAIVDGQVTRQPLYEPANLCRMM